MLNHCEVKNHHKGINESKWAVGYKDVYHPDVYGTREYIVYTCPECGKSTEVKGDIIETYSK